MQKIEILPYEKFEIFLDKKIKKILFIGETDTGKTGLIKDVANFLIENGNEVYIFDCDIGQSHVGPPTTIGYAKIKNKISGDFYLHPEKFYFVGAITPSSNIIEFITGVSKINQKLLQKEGKILIDTTGYLRDRTAICLKINKIEILNPEFVILIEKQIKLEEIERFLKFSGIKFFKIKVPENFPSKSMEERARYRKERFIEYFREVKVIKIDLEKVYIKIINWKNFEGDIFSVNLKGFLCSLRDEFFEDICLGIINNRIEKEIEIFIPSSTENENFKGIVISPFFLNLF